jgi:hypothetical protein
MSDFQGEDAFRIVVIHDKRLAGDPPTGGNMTTYQVSEKTPLEKLVKAINNTAGQYGDMVRLKILCHGYEDKNGHGGYGLALCKEGLNLNTVNQLAPWRNQLSASIWIYACATADVAPGCKGTIGDGRMLCSRIASTTCTGVRAADATQSYRHSFLSAINFGNWEGNVLYFDARGMLVDSEHEPEV